MADYEDPGRASLVLGALSPGGQAAVESALQHRLDERQPDIRFGPGWRVAWIGPVRRAILAHREALVAPLRHLRNMPITRMFAFHALAYRPGFDPMNSCAWHWDEVRNNSPWTVRVHWYGGEWEGGGFETRDRAGEVHRYAVRPGSLLAVSALTEHRRLPVESGIRLTLAIGVAFGDAPPPAWERHCEISLTKAGA